LTLLFFDGENPDGGGRVSLQSVILLPQDLEKGSKGILHRFIEKMVVNNPIHEMYEGLESQGITPGEEVRLVIVSDDCDSSVSLITKTLGAVLFQNDKFIRAVEEGAHLNSLIILGDRRMDITLRRLAKALVLHTDPQKLMEADRIITAKMKARMPELNKWEHTKKVLSKDEFATFVEQMKTKEATADFMSEIRNAAPELYNALVGERDIIMARGMNTLFSSPLTSVLPPSADSKASLDTMVAVVGLGHVEGIGRELRSFGWSRFLPSQC
jgi:hypothetical protein